VASQLNRLQHLKLFLWCVVDREVNKHPHNALASFNSKISDVMTNIGREIVILLCHRFWSQIEAIVIGFHEINVNFICI
jgi:hypothetical protein